MITRQNLSLGDANATHWTPVLSGLYPPPLAAGGCFIQRLINLIS